MKTLAWEEVCGRRLRRSLLAAPGPAGNFASAAGAMCGVQAQAPTAAELGIGIRVNGGTQAGVRADFWERRRLVRTYGLRGTVHVFPAGELPVWMAAMRAHAELTSDSWYVRVGLERRRGEAIVAAIGEALRGRVLTREQLGEEVVALTGEWARPVMRSSWGEALAPAAFAGLLCFAESQSGRSVYGRPDEWIGTWHDVEPQAALREVCRCYIRTYGPVTHGDLSRWLRVKPRQARVLLSNLGDELAEVAIEIGERNRTQHAWVLAVDVDAGWEPVPASVSLLPQYDAYVIAAGQRELMQPPEIKPRLSPSELGRFEGATGLRVVLIDGVIAGKWDLVQRRDSANVRVTPFRQLSEAERVLLAGQAARIGYYYDADVDLEMGAVLTGV